MRFRDIKIAEANKGSNVVRYNTELAMLTAFSGASNLQNIPDDALVNPENTKKEIKKVEKYFDQKKFDQWMAISNQYKEKILTHSGKLPQQYDWVGGSNIGPVADLVFKDHPASGISVKDASGITLANLTPKALGLEPIKGKDVFQTYADIEFKKFKIRVFNLLMDEAEASPGTLIHPRPSGKERSIMYNDNSKKFIIKHDGGVLNLDRSEVIRTSPKNATWQRVFGDWYQLNFQKYKDIMRPLVKTISKSFKEIMGKALSDSDVLKKLLQFEDKPYYYATPKKMYFVPSAKDAGDLELKAIDYDDPDGTSQKFKAKIGNVNSDDGAIIDIYIRFANGLFATNSTARVQSIKNPELIAWDLI